MIQQYSYNTVLIVLICVQGAYSVVNNAIWLSLPYSQYSSCMFAACCLYHPSSCLYHPSSCLFHRFSSLHHHYSCLYNPFSSLHHHSSCLNHYSSCLYHPSSSLYHPSSFLYHTSSSLYHPSQISQTSYLSYTISHTTQISVQWLAGLPICDHLFKSAGTFF